MRQPKRVRVRGTVCDRYPRPSISQNISKHKCLVKTIYPVSDPSGCWVSALSRNAREDATRGDRRSETAR